MSDIYTQHTYAQRFRKLTQAEAEALFQDVKANGLRIPITKQGTEILDGWNRYNSCIAGGIEPTFEEYTGNDPEGFIRSVNVHRRHLTDKDKHVLVVDSLKENAELSDRQIALRTGTSHPYVAKVRNELQDGDQLETVTSSIGGDGKKRPRNKKPKHPLQKQMDNSAKETVRNVGNEPPTTTTPKPVESCCSFLFREKWADRNPDPNPENHRTAVKASQNPIAERTRTPT
jgi:hypothetical protein